MPGTMTRTRLIAAVASLTLFACACGGGSAAPAAASLPGTGNPETMPVTWQGQMPAFPSQDAPVRGMSLAQTLTRLGNEVFESSVTPGAESALQVSAATGVLEYAIYQFPLNFTPLAFEVDVTNPQFNEYWLAFADFSTSKWDLLGPFNGDQPITFADLSGNFRSGAGNTYVSVLVFNGNALAVESAAVHYDDGQSEQANYLDDLQPLLAQNCTGCHGAGSFTGTELHAFWAVRENQGKLVGKVVNDTHGSLDQTAKDTVQSFVDNNGPYGLAVTYTDDIVPLTQNRCSPCHTGGNTSGGVSWASYATAFANGDNGLVQILSENMPKSGGPLTDAQKDIWQAWVDQGKLE